jgi:hypothetical protein
MATVPADAPRPTTADLHTAALAEARTQNTFDPREIRLSAAGGCPRKQTLRILGYPADEPDTQQLSIFQTGHYWEDYIAQLWESRYPGQVQRQVPVDTKYGTGHIDIWVEPLRHLVESKTTKAARRADLPLAEHVDQVHLYLHFWGQARGATAEIAYVIKETGEVLTFPVVYEPARIPRLLAALNAIMVAVTVDETPLTVPRDYQPHQFPCGWFTADGHLHRCKFWRHCWAGTPAAADTAGLVEAPDTWDAWLAQYRDTTATIADLKQQLKPLETQKKEVEQFLGQWLDAQHADGLRTSAGVLRRTVAKPTVSWDVDRAIADGLVSPDLLRPYQRTHAPRVTWRWQSPSGAPDGSSVS